MTPALQRIGIVTRSVGGFHTVVLPAGEEIRVVARGRLKRQGTILVGDRVVVGEASGGVGVVEEVLERRSTLWRPPIANATVAAVVTACDEPPPNLELLDRILLQVALANLAAVVVWNKSDLVSQVDAGRLAAPYRAAGYPVIFTSVVRGTGIGELRAELAGGLAVLAGPSGVGKSSLLNALVPGARQETQGVSLKTQRGRHTTREVSLLPLEGGGWIADSPGFSTLSFGVVDPRTLPGLYPEFRALESACRFAGCLHRQETGCAVREAAERGEIDGERYRRYLRILNEVEDSFEHRYQ